VIFKYVSEQPSENIELYFIPSVFVAKEMVVVDSSKVVEESMVSTAKRFYVEASALALGKSDGERC